MVINYYDPEDSQNNVLLPVLGRAKLTRYIQ